MVDSLEGEKLRHFEDRRNSIQKIMMNSFSLIYFWYKQVLTGEMGDLVDFHRQSVRK